MKNTRKKMLLSSIAMLLVALIALGSATYAWFVSDPTADAKGLSMKTESGKGLLVLSDSHNTAKANDWSHHTKLNATLSGTDVIANTTNVVLHPVTMMNSEATNATPVFIKTVAANGDSYARDTTKTIEEAVAGTDYYTEDVALKVTGGDATAAAKLVGVKWTGTDTLSAAVRVAVTNVSGNTVAIFSASGSETGYLDSKTSPTANKKYTPTTKNDAATGLNIALGDANSSGTSKIKVFVYLEGEDTACKSDSVSAADILNNLELYMTV